MELLAPAGGMEQLKAAVHFGADAVYLAGTRWGMRARAHNFSAEELEQAVAYAHEHDVAVHVTLNTLMYDHDLADLPSYLRFLDGLGVDALIVADLGALALAREHAPRVALHVSTQASVTNAAAALAYAGLGATRIVLAREMTLAQVAALRAQVGDAVELEAFVHGSLCVAYSGRCLLSAEMTGGTRSAADGSCAQPCRWGWRLVEDRTPERPLPVEQDAQGTYLLSSNDLCLIDRLDELAAAGVDSLKLEGRNKGVAYVAVVTNAYRHVLDGEPAGPWRAELDATSHRPFSEGFLFGQPTQNPGRVEYVRDRTLVGVVSASRPSGQGFLATVEGRNSAHNGQTLTLLSPGQPVRRVLLDGAELRNQAQAELALPFPVQPLDLLFA